MKTTIQECPKSQSNKTEYNKTKNNKTEINETEVSRADINPSNPINAGGYRTDPETMDRMEQMDFYRRIIRENISYGFCLSEPEYVRREVDELVELMVEVMASPDMATVRIAGQDKPAPVVKSRFMSLTYSHIEYVRLCLHRNTTKVENIKAYLLTALYNSSLTMNHYYQAEVNHDMYGDKAQGSGHGT